MARTAKKKPQKPASAWTVDVGLAVREHVVWKAPNVLACLHCGQHYEVNMPAPVDIVVAASNVFERSHKRCKLSSRGLACTHCFEFGHVATECSLTRYGGDWRRWAAGPDTGVSSRTICRRLAKQSAMHIDGLSFGTTPADGADFGRCHRLLKAIPGWRQRIGEMRDEPGWAPLVDVWDELEALYEEEAPSGNAPKLYARLSALRGV